MARRRMIDPEFWLDEKLASLSPHARLLFIGLWQICDDNYATFPDRSDWIKAQIFPYEKIDTHGVLSELSNIGCIVKFEHEGAGYWYIKNFFKYQIVNRPSKSKYPQYKPNSIVLSEPSVSTQQLLTEGSSPSQVKSSQVKIAPDGVGTHPSPTDESTAVESTKQFDSIAVIERTIADKKRYVQIIGLFFKFRKDFFPSFEQYERELKKSLKAAKVLESYGCNNEYFDSLFIYTEKCCGFMKERTGIPALEFVVNYANDFNRTIDLTKYKYDA